MQPSGNVTSHMAVLWSNGIARSGAADANPAGARPEAATRISTTRRMRVIERLLAFPAIQNACCAAMLCRFAAIDEGRSLGRRRVARRLQPGEKSYFSGTLNRLPR